jgi:Domain of unknown function (DUF4276)
MMDMAMQNKIGFIVEDAVDKAVVETLALRLLGAEFSVYAVRIGDPIAVRWAYSTALTLLDKKDYDYVFVLLDADSSLDNQIEQKRRKVEAVFEQHGLGEEKLSVFFAVPEIEAWLLAAYVEQPELSRDPQADLAKHTGERRLLPEHAAQLARSLDLTRARARAPSLDKFARALEHMAKELRRAPAA